MVRKINLTDTRIGKLRARDVEYTVWDRVWVWCGKRKLLK